ncbi:MAG: hypothetical protein ACOYMA_12770 [Bacteroidia bacterium]
MNKSIFITIILLYSSSLFAQTIEPSTKPQKPFQIQAGINVISFVRQFVNFSGNNSNGITSPYSINLKAFKQLAKQDALIGIRLGSGYVSTYTTYENQTTTGSTLIETLDFRAGLEYQKTISKRWVGYVGLDYIFQNGTNKFITNIINLGSPIVNLTTDNTSIIMNGGGLVFGMQFFITKRIALSTEATYYYSDSWSNNTRIATVSSNSLPPSTAINRKTILILPNMLNFTILF